MKQKEAWRVPLGTGRSGGTLATAGGLVFAGNSGNEFVAYRADSGAKLWHADAQVGTMAGPVSYEVDGEQYVAVVAGFRRAEAVATTRRTTRGCWSTSWVAQRTCRQRCPTPRRR